MITTDISDAKSTLATLKKPEKVHDAWSRPTRLRPTKYKVRRYLIREIELILRSRAIKIDVQLRYWRVSGTIVRRCQIGVWRLRRPDPGSRRRIAVTRGWRRRRRRRCRRHRRRRRRRRRGACRAVGGSGRATPGADWSNGTFEGGIRSQRRKNDKNEEREDLTYSLHVWCGASSRRRASRWRACADPFGVGDARRHLPPRNNLDQTTPTEGRHFRGERRLSEHRCNCWSLAIRRRSSLCRVASASVRLDKKWRYAK